jgi:predicted RNA binding protein YcfA (HicA-like mRNA interferase family)
MMMVSRERQAPEKAPRLLAMPVKIRQLKSLLRKAGFTSRPGKGSHTVWSHPKLSSEPLTMAGNDGDDAKPYQERNVRQAIKKAKSKK